MTPKTLRDNMFEVFENIVENDDTILVVGKKGNVVVLSEENYRGMMETMYLYSQPGVVEEILEAMKEPLEECIVLNGKL